MGLIVLFHQQCGCTLFEVGSVCTSRCTTCGVLCAAFPITDVATLSLYKTKGCTTVVGDLYIMNLPLIVTKKLLLLNLQDVQYIRGTLYVENNEFLTAMTFFSHLLGVEGIYYGNMPVLVDARMPSLMKLNGNVTVIGCGRLCPARYSVVGPSPNQAGCSNATVNWYLYVVGDATASAVVHVLLNVSSKVFLNVTDGMV